MAVVRIKDNFQLYPDDIYVVKIKEVKEQKTKDNINTFLVWNYDILEPEEFNGQTIGQITSPDIGPKSKYWRLLEALGVQVPEEGEKNIEYDTDDFIGAELFVEVITQKGKKDNVERNIFKNIWSPIEFEELQKKTTVRGASIRQPIQQQPSQHSAPPPPAGAPAQQRTTLPPRAPITQTARPSAPTRRLGNTPPPANNVTTTDTNLSDFPQ